MALGLADSPADPRDIEAADMDIAVEGTADIAVEGTAENIAVEGTAVDIAAEEIVVEGTAADIVAVEVAPELASAFAEIAAAVAS